MSGHTPGPWRIGDGSAESNYEGADCIIAERSGSCTTLVKLNHYFGDESLANACLIAAAPDLYEVCKEILAEFGYSFPVPHRERLEAAIKKAEGGI